jgi:predicted metal-dependent hydrolase
VEVLVSVKTNRRSRGLRLTVYPDGRVIVTKPLWVLESTARKFASSKILWIKEKQKAFERNGRVRVGEGTAREFKAQKDAAFTLVSQKIEKLNQYYGFLYKKICIRRQKTRWGSCSRQGNLNFNYKIVFLPENLQDYLIVHELCHLREFNHGKKFWDIVSIAIPDFKDCRARLKKMS